MELGVLEFAVLAFIGLTAFAGFSVGLAQMALTAGGWIGAAFCAAYGFAAARPTVVSFVGDGLLADALTVVGLFVLALILFTLLSPILAGWVNGTLLGPVNRSLGLVAGGLIGATVASLGWGAYDRLAYAEDRPAWTEESTAVAALDTGIAVLREAAPEGWADEVALGTDDAAEDARSAQEAMRLLGLDQRLPADTL